MARSKRTDRTPLRRRFSFWTPLLLLWGVPPLVLALVWPWAGAAEKTAVTSEQPATVVVGERQRDYRENVQIKFSLTREGTIHSAVDGLVTAVHAKPGKLKEGADLISVDGTKVRVHRGKAPFHRDLAAGDQGQDVVELERFLTKLDHPAQALPGDKVGVALTAAIKSYQREIGANPDGVFRPGYVIFVPKAVKHLGVPTLKPADNISTGDAIADGAERASAVKVLNGEDKPAGILQAPAPLILAKSGVEVEVETLTVDEAGTETLRRELIEAGFSEYVTEDGTENIFENVVVTVKNPVRQGAVPSGAVYNAPTAQQCVFTVPDADTTSTRAEAVLLSRAGALEGEPTLAGIDTDLIGTWVVRDPTALAAATLAKCS